jgi:hypothetical protein
MNPESTTTPEQPANPPVASSDLLPCVKTKRTPEQESYRIQRLREAMKRIGPRPEKWRRKISDGLNRAVAEGRLKPSVKSIEALKRCAVERVGKPMPRDVVEKVRLKNIGKKRTPEMVEAMRNRVIEGYAAGKYRLTPEALAERGRKISKARKGWKPSWDQRRRHSKAMTGRHQPDDVVEIRAAKMRGRPQESEATKSGPTNVNSLQGAIRDACGQIWRFRNLTDFVQTHPDLFEASDLIPEIRKGKPSRNCNASKRLLSLFGRGRTTPGTWKGWTVVSEKELGEDLLARNLQEAKQGNS